jgi:hypothetical protein
MPTNPYLQEYSEEQNLVEDITIEIIKGMGRDVIYVPRQYANIDRIFGEDISSKFTNSYPIEAYVDSWKGFNGTDIVNQFGIEVKDKLSLTVAKRRFEEIITASDPTITRPREGDLIYFPLSKSLFEINFVEHESPFYPLGKRYSYFLTCEMFSYSMEKIQTGNTAINEIYDTSYRTFFDLTVGSFSGGTAFYEGQRISKITGATGYGEIINWNKGASMLTINIFSGTFSAGSTVYALGDTAGNYPQVTAYITGITANPYRYMSHGPSKTLKGNNEDFEAERFSENVVPFDIKNPFSEGSC